MGGRGTGVPRADELNPLNCHVKTPYSLYV